MKEISRQHRDDSFLRDIIESVKSIKNDYRAHVRSEYPVEYDELKRKSAYMKEDIEELVYLYLSYNNDKVNKEEFINFIESSFHIKVLCKAYRKEIYKD